MTMKLKSGGLEARTCTCLVAHAPELKVWPSCGVCSLSAMLTVSS